jgi:hypothetical protein
MPISTSTSTALGYSSASLGVVALVLLIVTPCIWPSRDAMSSVLFKRKRATAVKVGISAGVLTAVAIIVFIVYIVLTSKMPQSKSSSSNKSLAAPSASPPATSGGSSPPPNILPVLAAGDGLIGSSNVQPSGPSAPIIKQHGRDSGLQTDKLSWRDQSPVSPGCLEAIVEFDEQDAPARITDAAVVQRDAHAPKPVPALPRRLTPRFYQPAFETAAEPVQFVPSSQADATHEQAPIYYAPPQAYPTVNDLVQERARFENRPDTPELQRHRRVTELREAAASLDPAVQRDGLMVPISGC